MKLISTIVLVLSMNLAVANDQCNQPAGTYTDLDMVLNQFVFDNGNPNWGDWCYELDNEIQGQECNEELNQWDAFIDCKTVQFTKSCSAWAKKENFASTAREFNAFVKKCIKDNFQLLR